MLTFASVRYQRGGNPLIHDVTIKISQGQFPDLGVITFRSEGFYFFVEEFTSYNDHGSHPTDVRMIFNSEEDIVLRFGNVTQQRKFANALRTFLRLR